MNKRIITLILLSTLFLSCVSYEKIDTVNSGTIRIAAVGDSITYGLHVTNRKGNSYPRQLENKLGASWSVANFGVSGATLIKGGNKPYVETSRYKRIFAYKPDIIIIILGTNDSKGFNWKLKDQFVPDYIELINTFKLMDSHPEIIICNPPPAFPGIRGIKDRIIRDEIIPLIEDVAELTGVELIDLYNPLSGFGNLFPDSVHPDGKGAEFIAEIISSYIKNREGIISAAG